MTKKSKNSLFSKIPWRNIQVFFHVYYRFFEQSKNFLYTPKLYLKTFSSTVQNDIQNNLVFIKQITRTSRWGTARPTLTLPTEPITQNNFQLFIIYKTEPEISFFLWKFFFREILSREFFVSRNFWLGNFVARKFRKRNFDREKSYHRKNYWSRGNKKYPPLR